MNELARFIANHPLVVFLALMSGTLLLVSLSWALLQTARAWRPRPWPSQYSWSLRPLQRLPASAATLLPGLLLGLVLVTAALSLFLAIADAIGVDQILGRFDLTLADALRQTLQPDTLRLFSWITHLGDTATQTALCTAVALWLLWRRQLLLAWGWIAAVAGNGLLNLTLKRIFERTRPLHDHGWAFEHSWSFPSGHASGAVASFGMLAWLLLRHAPPRWQLPLVLSAISLALLVGYSRIVLQVHYFSDVIAGFASGTAWLAVCIVATEIVRQRLPVMAASAQASTPVEKP